MKTKAPINIPTFDSTIGISAKNDYDFKHSEIINSLSYDDIIGSFGDIREAINYYKETLASGYPRSAAFLISKILKGSISAGGKNVAKRILLEDFSMMLEDNMATDADILISKIAKPTNKNKILFSSGHWLTGGMERVMSVLFREFKDDYEIFLITPFTEVESRIDIPDFVTSIKINSDLFVKHFDSIILSYASLLDVDVAIGYMNMFEKQLNLYNICVGTKIKTIASNHEYYFYPYKSTGHYQVVEKRLNAFAKCDAIVWPNNFSAALCGMYVENSYVIGNPNSFKVVQEIKSSKDPVIICVGRFNDYVKRIDRMLECFSLVLERVPNAKLVLVGKYDNNAPISQNDRTSVNDLINMLAIPSGSIDFVGEVNNVHDYYARAKVLMVTSNSEGFGMVLNEAACHGVPSVCNYIPGIEDIITDGENGFITEQDDIGSMAERVSSILNDEGLQKKLGMNAMKKAKLYDAKHISDKWRYLVNSLIEMKDPDSLHRKLNSELGFHVEAQQLSKVLSKELNEIFYMSIKQNDQHIKTNAISFILSKIKTLPRRFRANIEYEGPFNTGKKIVKRSYLIARHKLFKTKRED